MIGRRISVVDIHLKFLLRGLLTFALTASVGLAGVRPAGAQTKLPRRARSSRLAAAAPPESRPVEGASPGREAPVAARRAAAAPPNVTTAFGVVFVGMDMGGRQYHYNQRITNGTLRPYDLPAGALLPVAPGIAVSAEVYPLARADAGPGRDVGVVFDWRRDFLSTRIGDASVATQWSSWNIGVRGRFHTGRRGSSPVVGLEAGTGGLSFQFRDPGVLGPMLPSVDYRYLRLGPDLRVPFGIAAVTAGLGYRALLSTTGPSGQSIPSAGDLGQHFPHASIRGLDAKLGASVQIARWIEARLTVEYVRFWATLHPEVGATYVAGGALDQLLNADIGLSAYF